VKTIEIARDQFDALPTVAQYGGADLVIHNLAPPQSAPVLNAAAQQGVDVPLLFTPPIFNSAIIAAAGENAEGAIIARWYRAPDADVPGYDDYRTYLEMVDGVQYIADEFGTAAWVSVLAIDQAFRDCSDCTVDRAGALQALNGLSGFDAGGIAPVLDFSSPPTGPLAENFPRIFTSQGFAGIVENGQVVTFGSGDPLG
jgi:ABC-type branched-subunit amino acid transport system substrate-binding protein